MKFSVLPTMPQLQTARHMVTSQTRTRWGVLDLKLYTLLFLCSGRVNAVYYLLFYYAIEKQYSIDNKWHNMKLNCLLFFLMYRQPRLLWYKLIFNIYKIFISNSLNLTLITIICTINCWQAIQKFASEFIIKNQKNSGRKHFFLSLEHLEKSTSVKFINGMWFPKKLKLIKIKFIKYQARQIYFYN